MVPLCHSRRHRCDKVKVFSLLCAVISGFILLELFYTEITPIRKYVTPHELYNRNPRKWQETTVSSRFQVSAKPTTNPTPSENIITDETSHGIKGVSVERDVIHIKKKVTSVAIGCAITTRKIKNLSPHYIGQTAPIIRTFLSSFCKTASLGYDYHIYLTFDQNDPFFIQESAEELFVKTFYDTAKVLCTAKLPIKLHLKKVLYDGKPAWAQNDAMLDAYLDGRDYMFRVNDDIQLVTRNWTDQFIYTLMNSDPQNIGTVGPQHFGGNEAIITLDFVHRTHVDIFGFYYPRKFLDWFADDWITGVYQPRAYKLSDIKAVHTFEQGTRYNHSTIAEPDLVQKAIDSGKDVLNRFINMKRRTPAQILDKAKVISMCLYGNDPKYTMGAIRNAQLLPIIFPGWTLRIYVEMVNATGETKYQKVPLRIINILRRLGVQLVHVDAKAIGVPPMMWRFLVLDDSTVEYFIVRDVDSRLTERDADVVREWMKTEKPFHCVRDHPSHASSPVFGGLWGGRLPHLRELITIPVLTLMQGYGEGYMEDIAFMTNSIWPKVNRFAYCHDSVSCQKWANAYQFPVQRHGLDYVGAVYDQHGQLRQIDIDIMLKTALPRECSRYPDEFTKWEHVNGVNGILESAARKDIRNEALDTSTNLHESSSNNFTGFYVPKIQNIYTNVVIWSSDHSVQPIRGIKDVLAPLGVQFIDKSLAPDCTETCATDLRILDPSLLLHPNGEIIARFTSEYLNDKEMEKVTHILCTSPASICEFYTGLKKSVIIVINERYESAREDSAEWKAWNRHLSDISLSPSNLIAANNHYDVEYLRYFTGLNPEYLPSYCGYTKTTYKPLRPQVLLFPEIENKVFLNWFLNAFQNANERFRYNTKVVPVSSIYSNRHSFDDIAAHPAVVYVPYQASMFSACEHYSMSIPMFFPSLDLLTSWHLEYQVLTNLTLNKVRQRKATARGDRKEQVDMLGFGSPIESAIAGRWDPNNDRDRDTLRYWLRFADYYQWPHITHYESVEHLVFLLNTLDLNLISRKMSDYSKTYGEEIIKKWVKVLDSTLLGKQ